MHINYLMDLVIAHNPHAENPEELFDSLKMQAGESYIDTVEPDKSGLTSLQSLISPNMQK